MRLSLRVLRVFIGLFLLLLLLGFRVDGYGAYKPIINDFTFYHFLLGIGMGLISLRPKIVVAIVILWEILEQLILVPLGVCYPPELLLDSVLDIIVALSGYVIVRGMIGR